MPFGFEAHQMPNHSGRLWVPVDAFGLLGGKPVTPPKRPKMSHRRPQTTTDTLSLLGAM